MQYLFNHWPSIASKVQRAPHRLFLFDFDGTLTPIVQHSSQARLKRPVRVLLQRLAHQKATTVGVISGRSLKEVRSFVQLPNLIYSGNHGLELWDRHHRWVHPAARRQQVLLHQAAVILRRKIVPIPGAWVEDKGLSLSIHFRQASKADATVKREVRRTLRASPFRQKLGIHEGKKVLDIRPRIGWNKGSLLKSLTSRFPWKTVVVYTGDDTTDEDAFRVLRSKDLAVRIGHSIRSSATYYLKNQGETKRFLKELIAL